MTDYFVVTSKGFSDPEKAEAYAKAESVRTGRKYSLVARNNHVNNPNAPLAVQPQAFTVAVYENGERRERPAGAMSV